MKNVNGHSRLAGILPTFFMTFILHPKASLSFCPAHRKKYKASAHREEQGELPACPSTVVVSIGQWLLVQRT